jgi:hypothetical protein
MKPTLEEQPDERWKPITDYPYYEISDFGRIRSITRRVKSRSGTRILMGKLITQGQSNVGYPTISLVKTAGVKSITKLIHRLVAKEFVPNPDNKPCVNHKDGDKTNNNARNLEWVTELENKHHAYRIGLYSHPTHSSFTNEQAIGIIKLSISKTVSQSEIARTYGTSPDIISKLLKKKTYKKAWKKYLSMSK